MTKSPTVEAIVDSSYAGHAVIDLENSDFGENPHPLDEQAQMREADMIIRGYMIDEGMFAANCDSALNRTKGNVDLIPFSYYSFAREAVRLLKGMPIDVFELSKKMKQSLAAHFPKFRPGQKQDISEYAPAKVVDVYFGVLGYANDCAEKKRALSRRPYTEDGVPLPKRGESEPQYAESCWDAHFNR